MSELKSIAYKVAAPEEQDKLKVGLIKTEQGDYFPVGDSSFKLKGELQIRRAISICNQDKLAEQLVGFSNYTYRHVGNIEEIIDYFAEIPIKVQY